MRRGNNGNTFLFHLSGCGIDDRDFPGDAASSENLFDVLIVTLLDNERNRGASEVEVGTGFYWGVQENNINPIASRKIIFFIIDSLTVALIIHLYIRSV